MADMHVSCDALRQTCLPLKILLRGTTSAETAPPSRRTLAEHIRLKLQQHDLLRIYNNLEVRRARLSISRMHSENSKRSLHMPCSLFPSRLLASFSRSLA